MRSILFQGAFWLVSVFFVFSGAVLLLLPTRRPLMIWARLYTRSVCLLMRLIGGIDLQVRGRDRLPQGPMIVASKHQSWGDGFFLFSQFDDAAFIISDQFLKYPLIGRVFRKMQAVVVDNQRGGPAGRDGQLAGMIEDLRAAARPVLVYPEGKLSALGQKHRYRRGVYYVYKLYECPVVPVATNLGVRWLDKSWSFVPGPAAIEFLEPIPPGLPQKEFMALLEARIETRSREMLPETCANGAAQAA
ncbi:1-acyl-sn-glycerol-3-phosphate acyltransferase [Parvularcula sp. IMCC14364]|uniref:lysophospholipid acyltransferase family protein n=1 Tax=Parvularcula sp. IMCC14364 TaxID=3067902 RepID=UPI00274220DF|nr:lysophospholipid acyltransferase family protein [Parvularcula sp. IMCC14364]